jgi:hypothetical protein
MSKVRSALLAAAGVMAWTPLVAVHAPPGSAARLPLVLEEAGAATPADRAHILERAFIVPPGTNQIDIDFRCDRSDPSIEFDLGVRAPNGSRGWSEDRTDHIHIDPTSASYGFRPGPMEPGVWALQIGVAHVPEGSTPYQTTVRLSDALDAARPVLRGAAGWYVGDLHAHSGHSDGYHTTREGVRVPVPVQDLVAGAVAGGLDFLAITDHNTTSQWLDIDRLQPADRRVLLLHGSEITTYQGHFNSIGARRGLDVRLGPTRPMLRLLEEAASDGGFLSINHPLAPIDDEWCAGCGWVNRDSATIGGVRGIEIVNGPITEDPSAAWQWWAELTNAGHHLVAVGGSDSHDPASSTRRLGQPATVVFASELSEAGIAAGLKSGRVYVRTEGPDGPSIELHGRSGGRRAEMGGSLPAGTVRLAADVVHARGQECVWIRRGRVIRVNRIESEVASLALETDAVPGDWFTIVIRSRRGPTVLGNAIYIDRSS